MTASGPNHPRLVEAYFTPNPDELSDIGLIPVPVEGEESLTGIDEAFADVIRQAIDITGPDDPEALILEALYRGTGIPRDLMGSVQSTITDITVGLPLRHALNKLHGTFPGVVANLDLVMLRHALDHNSRRGIVLLNGDGIRAVGTPDGSLQPIEDPSAEAFLSDDERRIARQLGAGAFAYNMELVWDEDSSGEVVPRLLSRRMHLAVGRVVADGTIDHVGTILSPEHPVRSGVLPASS